MRNNREDGQHFPRSNVLAEEQTGKKSLSSCLLLKGNFTLQISSLRDDFV